MVNRLSVYVSDSLDVYKNLATEKYLFDSLANDETILYLWQNEGAVVIGRNQNTYAECNLPYIVAQGIKISRRLSGGGAVFHDFGNLNFTFMASKSELDVSRNMKTIADACDMVGITVQISGRNDLLCDGRKFSGNAFYNSGEKALHHGTIMVSCNLEKMQKSLTPCLEKLSSKGVKSVKSRVVNLSEISPSLTCGQMREHLICCFERSYGMKALNVSKTDEEKILATSREYRSHEYIFGKSPALSFSVKGRFDWGIIEIIPEIKNERICSLTVYSDSLIWQLPELVTGAVSGCRFNYGDVFSRLSVVIEEKMAGDICGLLFKPGGFIN